MKNAHLLPPFSKVLSTWMELVISGQLFQALLVSLQALFLGFLLSVGLGVPLGLLMDKIAERIERRALRWQTQTEHIQIQA